MKRLAHILFLSIAFLFSFGLSSSTPVCQIDNSEQHSCCKKDKPTPKTPCKQNCCLQSTVHIKLEEAIAFKSTKQVIVPSDKPLKATIPFANIAIKDLAVGINLSVWPFIKIKEVSQFLSLKQSWLI